MSQMIEAHLSKHHAARRLDLVAAVASNSGILTFEEDIGTDPQRKGRCLTFEFASVTLAEDAKELVAKMGIFVEGPQDY